MELADYFYLYQEIETIRQKPGLYLGKKSITALYYHLGGFESAIKKFGKENISKNLLPLPFIFFNEYVSNHFYGNKSAMGWCNIILEKNNFDEEKSLDLFFELFHKFASLSIQHCQYAKLDEEAKTYHYTNEYTPTIIRQRDDLQANAIYPQDYKPPEPLYLNATEIYLAELADSGFIYMVNTDTQHRIERRIYKTEIEAKKFLTQCFGTNLEWNDVDMDNYEFFLEFSIL